MVGPRTRAATVDRLLLTALQGTVAADIAVDSDELAAVDPGLHRWSASAAWHRVDPWAWLAIRHTSLGETAAGSELARRYEYGIARHLRMLEDLRCLQAALADAGIPFAAFKGAVLAEIAYPRPDLRAYNDLDVLVSPSQFALAVATMEAQGCRLLDRNWSLLTAHGAGQVHLLTPLQSVIDLHWNLMNTPPARDSFRIVTDDLLRRTTVAAVRDVTVPVLEPVDMLLHICLHASLAGANRLCWLKDIAQLLRASPYDWDAVIKRAQQWRAPVAVGVALSRAAHVFDAQVPIDASRGLVSSYTWRGLTHVVDRLFPPNRTHSGGSVNRIVARAARSNGRTTWLQLARRVSLATARGGPLRVEHQAWEVADDDPRSPRYPAGSFSQYLDYVAGQATVQRAPENHGGRR